ncbi:hypothetical protein EOPP23_09805 [Endozoicomonas sp. OPT23]|uniref:hypothetical protein n=1 Tax=Endozoicomonas sp. OPT23 TaxID=2072845 RepID=UPI00129AFDB4|nr:hypothetical protein [Endozoicomonas sp. OPT23]MRI33276.1 hypothetical protein [Endozoicomonas sp. OPT23]
MRFALSALLKVTAIVSLGFWWLWLFVGTGYYYLGLKASLWTAVQSGAGFALVIFVIGMLSSHVSEILVPAEDQ